ncbi:VWA domain-containing protein [Paenibacillus sp. 2TAB23]|uniref:vWA domain-containing protein n=1 Tax=Paenibacillus sp. 2TAB23 TaxID=3233004 RepID=UPI003F947075
MQFLSLSSAWFAAALPAIAAMYLLKRTYERKEIASHLLWRRVLQEQEANRPWQKLRARLLLFIQLLIAILLVLALMQPVVTKDVVSTGHAVIVIDRSASMASKLSQPTASRASTRLELAIEHAAIWMDEQPGKRTVSLIAIGAQPELLVSEETDKAVVKQQLARITPYYGKSDRIAALSLADSILQNDPTGEMILFSDGHWADAEEASNLQLEAPVRLIVVDGEATNRNVTIMYFGIKAAAEGSASASGVITIRNDSEVDRKLQLEIYAVSLAQEEELVSVQEIAVPGGEWESAEVQKLPAADYYKARINERDDRFVVDNTAYHFPENPQERQILLVTEGNLFLEKALQLAGVQAIKASPDQVAPSGEQASELDWIILDGVDDRLLADPSWSVLLDQKPLWMIDHPDPLNKNSEVPVNNRVVTKKHAVTAYVTFSDTHISRLARLKQEDLLWAEDILSYGGIPAIYAGTNSGKPQLRFTFNLQDSDLPLRPEFPVLIVQAVEWMNGGKQLNLGTAISGERVEISFQSDTAKAEWVQVARNEELSNNEISRTAEVELEPSGLYMVPEQPGLYRLMETNEDNRIVGNRLLAVTNDHTELTGSQLKDGSRLLLGAGTPDGQSKSEGSESEPRAEQALSLQIYAAMLLLLIMGVEWEVYRRGLSS